MEQRKTIAWWLAPAVLVLALDAWFVVHELVGGSVFGDVDPRVGVRLGATGIWLAFAVAMAVGIVFSRRRPGLAGGLLIVGSLPAVLMFWAPAVVAVGLASWVGAIYHIVHNDTRAAPVS